MAKIFYAIFLFASCSYSSAYEAYTLTGHVLRVSDGDTFLMVTTEGVPQRIRLRHIDSPERAKPYYKKAKLMLKALVADKAVTATCTWIDGFNRDLCNVDVNGDDVARKMIEQGGAWLHHKYYDYVEDPAQLVAAQKNAQQTKQGLWGISEYLYKLPWEF